jgi:hypothetical protein
MAIEHRIDPARRLVLAKVLGTLTDAEILAYKHEVWSCPEVAGYDELVDVSDVERIALPSAERVRQLASLSSGMDARTPAKLAIVAPQDVQFGLGRMYQVYRELESRSTKQVHVFRSLELALAWLGMRGGEGAPRKLEC